MSERMNDLKIDRERLETGGIIKVLNYLSDQHDALVERVDSEGKRVDLHQFDIQNVISTVEEMKEQILSRGIREEKTETNVQKLRDELEEVEGDTHEALVTIGVFAGELKQLKQEVAELKKQTAETAGNYSNHLYGLHYHDTPPTTEHYRDDGEWYCPTCERVVSGYDYVSGNREYYHYTGLGIQHEIFRRDVEPATDDSEDVYKPYPTEADVKYNNSDPTKPTFIEEMAPVSKEVWDNIKTDHYWCDTCGGLVTDIQITKQGNAVYHIYRDGDESVGHRVRKLEHAPCPKCGKTPVYRPEYEDVDCGGHWTGPVCDTEAEAWAEWDNVVWAYLGAKCQK